MGMGHGAHYNTTKEKLAEFQAHRTANSIQVEVGQVFVEDAGGGGGALGREDEMICRTTRRCECRHECGSVQMSAMQGTDH